MRFIYFVITNKKYVTDIMILPLYKAEIICAETHFPFGPRIDLPTLGI